MSDECASGRNGCFSLQELQKMLISLKTEKNELAKDVEKNCTAINDITKMLFKQAAILGGITAAIQLIFKFWN